MSVQARVDLGHRKGPRTISTRDHCSRDGADCIALAIESYWSARGFSVTVSTVPGFERPQYDMPARYDVRSDMINGWPVRK